MNLKLREERSLKEIFGIVRIKAVKWALQDSANRFMFRPLLAHSMCHDTVHYTEKKKKEKVRLKPP